MKRRTSRPLSEMVDALERQTLLLQEFCQRAFGDGDLTYLAEIANKLRLLSREASAQLTANTTPFCPSPRVFQRGPVVKEIHLCGAFRPIVVPSDLTRIRFS